jgi:hypothetical protein
LEREAVNDSILAKLVVTVIVLISFILWRMPDRSRLPGCQTNCATDISANRR